MTAATTTAAAASQELSQSGKSLDPSRAGTKYPVQESLTSMKQMYACINFTKAAQVKWTLAITHWSLLYYYVMEAALNS